MNPSDPSLKPRILVVPLDWGLGHATRCIPLIRALLQQGAEVILGGEGKTKALLEQEFNDLFFVDLKGYDIRYSSGRWQLPFMLGAQIPKILSVIKYENERLRLLVKEHRIDAVISDNRYGLYHPGIPSVLLTHQLRIQTGFGKAADDLLQSMNYKHINHFTECWVPDVAEGQGLSGILSHPSTLPKTPVRYIGPITRFSSATENVREQHVLILLSGPEPQRSILEKRLIGQLEKFQSPVVLVRGLPGSTEKLKAPHHVTIHNHLPASMLAEKLAQASFVIARCGYSTVMDLATLQKKNILIATPGQTEQEYLSHHLMEQKFALCIPQDHFEIKPALDLAKNFPYQFYNAERKSKLNEAITDLLHGVPSKVRS